MLKELMEWLRSRPDYRARAAVTALVTVCALVGVFSPGLALAILIAACFLVAIWMID